MFTGLIEAVGAIRTVTPKEGGKVFGVKVPFKPVMGESIAVSGACITVSGLFKEGFFCFASPETLARTTLGSLGVGSNVHVERAMPAEGRFGGHIVSGHVDGVGKVVSMKKEGETALLEVRVPRELRRFLVPKGSIAVDGVSLTINTVSGETISVTLIPFTLKMTLFEKLRPGDAVNLEIDVISKLVVQTVERMLGGEGEQAGARDGGVTRDLLLKAGFIRDDG
jgi:riboflavin synthase